MERPSGSTATPSASTVPDVICSGFASGKRWRHRWLCPSTEAVKYIHDPSGDQPADLHGPFGPIGLTSKRPSSEISRHGAKRLGKPRYNSYIRNESIALFGQVSI